MLGGAAGPSKSRLGDLECCARRRAQQAGQPWCAHQNHHQRTPDLSGHSEQRARSQEDWWCPPALSGSASRLEPKGVFNQNMRLNCGCAGQEELRHPLWLLAGGRGP